MLLYGYQHDCIRELLRLSKTYKKLLLSVPTGGGKTVIASAIVQRYMSIGGMSLFCCHRRELIEQAANTMREADCQPSIIQAGATDMVVRQSHPLKIASIPTLHSRIRRWSRDNRPPPWKINLIIWDEAHHMAANTWKQISEYLRKINPDMVEIGLTATPARTDGKPLGEYFDILVQGPSVADLVDTGYLSPFIAVAPATPLKKEREKMKIKMGDFSAQDQAKRIQNHEKVLANSAIALYKKHSAGEPAIFYGVDIEHSQRTAERFRDAGVPAGHVDGKMPIDQRERVIKDFRDKKILVLCNVGIVSEGFDVPEATTIIFGRSTQSLTLWLQACGRALRQVPGKVAKIIDQGWNVNSLGLPTKEHRWSLDAMTDADPGGEGLADTERRKLCPDCEVYVDPVIVDSEARCPRCDALIYKIEQQSAVELEDTEMKVYDQIGEVEKEQLKNEMPLFDWDQIHKIWVAKRRGSKIKSPDHTKVTALDLMGLG